MLFLAELQASACEFPKSNNSPWVFLKFFKLYKWYLIARSITYKYQIHGISQLNETAYKEVFPTEKRCFTPKS